VIRLLRTLSIYREQIRELHQECRELAVRNVYLERRNQDLDSENIQLRGDLLDHHFICIKGEVNR